MGSHLGPTMENVFLSFYKIKWVEHSLKKFKPIFTEYVDDIFVLFKYAEYLRKFRNHFNTCHRNMSFSFEQEKGKFLTTAYRKPIFSGVYTQFESFLPTIYKFAMVYTLAYHFFKICSDWAKFLEEPSFLKQVFWRNGYLLSFIDSCFKTFVDKLFIKSLQLITVEKKTLFLSLPYVGEISLKTTTKLKKFLKGLLNSCKLQIVFKS